MKRFTHRVLLAALAGACFLPGAARAESGPPASQTWLWPLYEIDAAPFLASGDIVTTHPRPAIWSSHGEYQNFGEGSDVHPGIDIRGDISDAVLFPIGGTLVHTSNRDDCTATNQGPKCRLWVRVGDEASAQYIYYVGHMDLAHQPFDAQAYELRDAITNSWDKRVEGFAVERGQFAGQLNAGYYEWAHLHVGIYDRADRYASLDPMRFLEREAVGEDGTRLLITDDERPVFHTVEFLPNVPNSNDRVIESGLCGGMEVRGAIDIKADIDDTFYADPAPRTFLGDDLQPTQGLRGGRIVVRNLAESGAPTSHQWFESPLGCTKYDCGLWRLKFREQDRNGFNGTGFINDDTFFAWLDSNVSVDGAAKFAGGDFTELLYVSAESDNDHGFDGLDVPIVHMLTNNIREDGSVAASSWDTTALADGRYVVSVEGWDNDGNAGGQSFLVTINNSVATVPPSTITKGWAEVILKDHEGDVGQIPSNLGGEPWWASNDIVIVAAGSARPDCITPARGIPLVANESYDVYVRAHNTGCQAMEGIRAAVYAATPGTMMTDLNAISDDGVYSGGSDGPQTAPPGDCAIIGKFPWTPTQAELGGSDDGHRCLLAAITSDLDPGPAVNPGAWVPAEHDNVTQRNIQVSALEYFIRNATSAAASSELVLDMGAFPAGTSGASFKFFVDDPNAELDPIWQGTPGVVISRDGSNVVVDVQAAIVTLPAFPMPAVSARASRVEFTLPFDSGPYRVVLTHRLDGVDVGGMIFDLSGPRTPH